MNPPPPADAPTHAASRLAPGARGVVAAIEGGEATVARFASLGIVPGTPLRVVRGGSPMAVAVGDARLGLGPRWANALQVVPL